MPAAVLAESPPLKDRPNRVPPLENGDQLNADEFLRRYSAMPQLSTEHAKWEASLPPAP